MATIEVVGTEADPTAKGPSYARLASPTVLVVISAGANPNEVLTVDVSDPENPTVQDTLTLDQSWGHDASGDYAYVPSVQLSKLTVVDISDPTNISVAGSVTSGTWLGAPRAAVYDARGYVYVCGFSLPQFGVVDVSTPTAPATVGAYIYDTGKGGFSDLTYPGGDYVYAVARSTDWFVVIDVSTPTSPSIVGTLQDATDLNTGTSSLVTTIGDDYAFVTTDDGKLTVIDISNPAAPSIVAAPSISLGGNKQAIAGDVLWATRSGTDEVVAVDVSDPTNPVEMATLADGADLNGAASIDADGSYAYVACSNGNSIAVVRLVPFLIPQRALRAYPRDDILGRVPTPRHPKFSRSQQYGTRQGPSAYK